MTISVFSKSATSKEGKPYSIYLGRLTNKATGAEVSCRIKFRESAGKPKEFPCNIVVDKEHANLVTQTYVVPDTGEERITRTLWVSAWTPGPEYIDHSLDEYE